VATTPSTTSPPPPRILNLDNIADRMPVFTRGNVNKVFASDFAIITATDLPPGAYQLRVNDNLTPVSFTDVPDDHG
jgi:hypothetical protein